MAERCFATCAELDLDGLVEDRKLLAAFPLHTPERMALAAAWLGVRLAGGSEWPHGWQYFASFSFEHHFLTTSIRPRRDAHEQAHLEAH